MSPSASESKSISPSVSISPSASASKSISPSVSISPSASASKSVSPSPSAGYALYTRGDEATLPTNDDDLETNYSAQDILDVATSNDVRVNQSATAEYAIHQYKDFSTATPEDNECIINWEGQTDLDPATSPVYLQIYNQVTPAWETISQVPIDYNSSFAEYASERQYYTSPGANVDFTMRGIITDLTNYKKDNLVSCRIWQLDV